MVQLREITPENLDEVLRLGVAEGQRGFVSSPAESLAQAWTYRDTAFPFAVCDGERTVGFIMFGYYEKKAYYTLWKLLIDERYQNRGCGRAAIDLGIAWLRARFGAVEVYTGVVPENTVARRLYRAAGFVETGVFADGMIEMRLPCAPPAPRPDPAPGA